jgi:glycosyltransferase involved in cell wall biosynthesis
MKILILIDAWFPFTGGAQIQIKNLKQILEKDYSCKYYILYSPSSNVFIRFLWSTWVIPQAIFLNKRHSFDLIHAHAYWPGIPGKIISKILNIPIVFTVHGSNLLDLKKLSIRACLEKFILTQIRYDRVISVSSRFLKHRNINKNIEIIANGVDVELFDAVKAKKVDPFKIIFVGRDDKVKGLRYLKKSMSSVKQQIPNVRLKIIEKGYSYQQLIRQYKSSHLFVLPSLSEGQPLTLLEAWAAKLPVVVTDVGDNSKMVKNGVNGYLVKPGNAQQLSKIITRVLRSEDRDKMGEKGYELVKRKYSWEQCAQKTYEVYKKTIRKR